MARLKIGFIPIEGGHYYGEALEEVTRAEEPRLYFAKAFAYPLAAPLPEN